MVLDSGGAKVSELFVFSALFLVFSLLMRRKPNAGLLDLNERLITRSKRLQIIAGNLQGSWNNMIVTVSQASVFAPPELQVPLGAAVSACAEDLKDMLGTNGQMALDTGAFVEATMTGKPPRIVDVEVAD